jgi:hypothetical protein
MSLIIPPGFGQLVFKWNLSGDAETMVNTIGVDLPDPAAGQEYVDGAAAQTRISIPVDKILLGYSFSGCTLYVGQDGGPPAVYESVAVVHNGTNGGPALPPNCAYLIRKHSGLGGRRNRGRMFLPAGVGPGEDSVPSTGVMAEAQRADLETRVRAWLTAITGTKVIFHDSSSPGSSTPTEISSFTVEARLATTRRRLRP